MQYEIRPLVGVGDARFGMHPPEIAGIFGPPLSTRLTTRGEREETRRDITVRYDSTGVVEFAFLPGCKLLIDGIDLFGVPDPVELLLKHDPEPRECFGFLVFRSLGVAVTGYHDEDQSQRAITTFTTGRWRSMEQHFKPFSHSR